MELTDKQIERQDFVDGAIFELLHDVNPTDQNIDWDIEYIAEIRDVINWIFTQRLNFCSEQEFYPFIEE